MQVLFSYIQYIYWTRRAYYVLILYLGMEAHKGITVFEYLWVNKEK